MNKFLLFVILSFLAFLLPHVNTQDSRFLDSDSGETIAIEVEKSKLVQDQEETPSSRPPRPNRPDRPGKGDYDDGYGDGEFGEFGEDCFDDEDCFDEDAEFCPPVYCDDDIPLECDSANIVKISSSVIISFAAAYMIF